MRIVFMGTAAFATPSLERLLEAGHEILAVVTQPDRPAGRKRVLTPPPVKVAAAERGLPVLQPERLRRDRAFLEAIRAMAPDLVAYAAYGQIIPPAFLEIPRLGCWNVHGSLLPAYRGAAPIQRALMNGDIRTGVTIMMAEAGLDTGPILAAREMDIRPDDTYGTLAERMSGVGADLLVGSIAAWERGELTPRAQDDCAATYAPAIEAEDSRLDWALSARRLDGWVRGLNPKPGAWTTWRGGVFKVWEASATDSPTPGSPGEVRVNAERVLVATGDGALSLRAVQPSGGRRMTALDWARGLRGHEQFI